MSAPADFDALLQQWLSDQDALMQLATAATREPGALTNAALVARRSYHAMLGATETPAPKVAAAPVGTNDELKKRYRRLTESVRSSGAMLHAVLQMGSICQKVQDDDDDFQASNVLVEDAYATLQSALASTVDLV